MTDVEAVRERWQRRADRMSFADYNRVHNDHVLVDDEHEWMPAVVSWTPFESQARRHEGGA